MVVEEEKGKEEKKCCEAVKKSDALSYSLLSTRLVMSSRIAQTLNDADLKFTLSCFFFASCHSTSSQIEAHPRTHTHARQTFF